VKSRPGDTTSSCRSQPATRQATRIPRRQSLPPTQEQHNLLVPRSSKDQLLLFAPQRAALSLALLFPVQYHAVGECLAHPHRPCNCVKTCRMAQSQAHAWNELGRRFKERCPLGGGGARGTVTGRSRLARRRSCFEVDDCNALPDPPALTRLFSTPQKSCPVTSLAAAACGPVRRTASTGTPGAVSRSSSAQASPQPTLLLRQQTLRLRMRELEHARAHRIMEARPVIKGLPKLAGSRRNHAADASG